MRQIDVLSEQDLVEIVERASSVDERLGDDFVPAADGGSAEAVDRRLEAWSQALGRGDEDRFRRRLAWDGLDPESVRPVLGPVRLREGVRLPEWSGLIAEVLRLAPPERQDGAEEAWPEELSFLDAEDVLPFEEILAPFVLVARERLAGRAAAYGGLLSAGARTDLERTLLRSLSFASGELFLAEFEAMRAQEQSSWDRLFALAQDPEGRSLYRRFVRRSGEGGMASLFRRYPVLARHLGTISQLWVEANEEFLGRLEEDLPELERLFGDERFGEVVGLGSSLSDPHCGRRSVLALTFASGRKVVYKPKDMGTEAAYHRLLAWLNERGAPLPFKVLKVLDRSTHGWVEFVEYLPCQDEDEARRYYERAGMLLCLFYALEGTDCHYENIIASGEYPVLIDTETLMHHRARAVIPDDENAQTEAFERLGHSVLRTGLLPRWELSVDEGKAYHVSGLGEAEEQEWPIRMPTWVRKNTDRMALEYDFVKLQMRENVPTLEGVPLSLQEYATPLVDGFRRMYRFLLEHREALLTAPPLQELARQQVRFVFRATKVYGLILRNLLHRQYLRDGADRSIQLEQLGRAQVPPRDALDEPDERPIFWPVFAAERLAMETGDVPFFTARASSDALILAPGQEVEGCLQEPSFELVSRVLEGLGDSDLEQQVAFIEGSLYAHLARETTASHPVVEEPQEDFPAGPPEGEDFIAPALELAEAIKSRAIRTEDGSAAWIAPQYLVQAERYQLQVMDFSLYGGTAGVALFLAAAEQFAPDSGYGELAQAALRPLRSARDRRPDRFAERMGIGGASGIGSVAYSLLHVGRLLDNPALLEEARRVADLITDDLIASDKVLDVIGGAAGAILSLTALYGVMGDQQILERAIACGEHLLEMRTETGAGPRAWATSEQLRTTGFSHGTAGIAYALLRLYEHTRDERLLEAADEAIAYEDTMYSPENHNWADHVKSGESNYLWQWCRGAPGIGLARVGGLDVLDTGRVREDIELAMQSTLQYGVRGVDHPCCGSMGLAEVLLSAGQRLARPELEASARTNAWRVLDKANRTGGFVLHPLLPRQVDNPGFFQGTAGIGYELLRMARPDLLPSVLLWE
ncbi:MAG TPA: type 2 lanthipeptide synthetase LanM family protein [Rubrobacter sp.]|nr:type 2 lanthipeptide synthetase LanM family protein [Rubrobacter sp.]